MKNIRKGIVIALIISIGILSIPTNRMITTAVAYTPHSPIVITSDDDFITQGWSGEGIVGNPYVIEGLNITSTEICVSIANTLAVFEVRNCYFSSPSFSSNRAVKLENVTQGAIIGCSITNHNFAIYLSNASYCWISNNTVSVSGSYARGFDLLASNHTTLYNNTAVVAAGSTFAYAYCLYSSFYCVIEENIANIAGFSADPTINQVGFMLTDSPSCTLLKNYVYGCVSLRLNYGYMLTTSDACSLSNNTAYANGGVGFYIISNLCSLSNNTAQSYIGFLLLTAAKCNLTDNLALNAWYGFQLDAALTCNLSRNTAANGKTGFYIRTFYGSILINNTAKNNLYHGFHVYESRNVVLSGNIAFGNDYAGFCLNSTAYCTVIGNKATYNSLSGQYGGFFFKSVFNCTIEKNNASLNLWYLFFFDHSHACVVKDNFASDTSGYSIYLSYCNSFIILNNSETNSPTGVYLQRSYWCNLTKNLMYNNTIAGLRIDNSADCHITRNAIHNNSLGILISGGSTQNSVFYNWIGPNTVNVQCELTGNYWDDGITEGNHWSDYNGSGMYQISTSVECVDRFPKGMEPSIDHPVDISFEEGSTNNHIEWHVYSPYPSFYELYIETGSNQTMETVSWNGSDISISVDGLVLGNYTYRLIVYDTSGNFTSDTVNVTIIDTTPPSLDSPPDLFYELGTVGHTIVWILDDLHMESYEIIRNATPVEGLWEGSTISLLIDDLAVGTYHYTITVFDSSNNSASDTVIITIIDRNSPTIDRPADLIYELETTGQIIQWNPFDFDPDSYVVMQNGTIMHSDLWNGSSIIISVDGFDVGSYNITIVVYDKSGNMITDEVLVTVVSIETTTSSKLISPEQMIAFALGGGLGIIAVIVVLIFKKKR